MKKISIIIATFNAGQTLSRCFDSVIPQKNDEIELLVIDGASTDGTLDIIQKYANAVDKYVSEKDNGIYDAWNKGILLSSGQWLEFLGADDVLLPNAIDYMLEAISNSPMADIISGKAKLVDTSGTYLKDMGEAYCWQVFRKRMNISHGSTLHRRELFDELGLFDVNFKICGDYELLLRKKLNANFIDEYFIQMQSGGMSTTLSARHEAFLARKKNKTLPTVRNYLLGFREYVGYIVAHRLLRVL